jgi:hypothetical protein
LPVSKAEILEENSKFFQRRWVPNDGTAEELFAKRKYERKIGLGPRRRKKSGRALKRQAQVDFDGLGEVTRTLAVAIVARAGR